MDARARIEELFERINQSYETMEKITCYQEIIRLADQEQLTMEGIVARLDLMLHKRNRKSLLDLAWILAKIDQDPALRQELVALNYMKSVLLRYYLILETMAGYPEVGKQKIWEMLDDFVRRLQEHGYQYQVMEQRIRLDLHQRFGELTQAKAAYHAFVQALEAHAKDSELDEPDEWDIYTKARIQAEVFADVEQAMQQGRLILLGHVTGSDVDVWLPSRLILPLWETGRYREAEQYQRQTEREIIARGKLLDLSWHVSYLALTDQLERAVEFFQEYVADGFYYYLQQEMSDPDTVFQFLLHVRVFFHRLQQAGQRMITVYDAWFFPISPLQNEEFSVAQMVQWLDKQLTDLATRFDRRNGNQYYQQWMQKCERWVFF